MQLLFVLLSGSLIDLDGTIFIQFALFFLAFLILRPLVFRPVVRLIEAREEAIEGAVEQAKVMTTEAHAAEKEFNEEMKRVRHAAREEHDRLRNEGKQLEQSLITKVRQDTDKQLEEAEATLKREAKKVRAEMAALTPVLAKDIATKLLEREVV